MDTSNNDVGLQPDLGRPLQLLFPPLLAHASCGATLLCKPCLGASCPEDPGIDLPVVLGLLVFLGHLFDTLQATLSHDAIRFPADQEGLQGPGL